MSKESRIDPQHRQIRSVLRVLGPMILIVGGVFVAIGLISFFSAFGSFEPPRYFWCAFVGGPLVVCGLALTSFGFMGAITRYQAGEVAPVGKDTFNYLADGTQGGIRTLASAIGDGLAEGLRGDVDSQQVRCSACGHANEPDSSFCSSCGEALVKHRTCPSCGEPNDVDARFCDHCGSVLSETS